MTEDNKNIKLKYWLLAARPKTLPAAFVPVIVGSALAIIDNSFKPTATIIALLCSLLLQIGANFSNDLFDHLKGADKKDRVGPLRVLSSGLLSIAEMKLGLLFVYALCFFLGLYLVYIAGWIILIVGILSILMSLAYTAGPFPLAYNGLGDAFVFIFFGLIGTIGTYYVQTLQISTLSVLCAIPVGALITNILVVNNYRDIEEDKIVNKKTLAVIFGKTFSKFEYVFLLAISFVVLIPIYFLTKNIFVFLPVIILPLSIFLIKMLFTYSGKDLNKTLALSAFFAALYGILLSIGIII